mgnify:CR=1 FL=1
MINELAEQYDQLTKATPLPKDILNKVNAGLKTRVKFIRQDFGNLEIRVTIDAGDLYEARRDRKIGTLIAQAVLEQVIDAHDEAIKQHELDWLYQL